MIPPDHSSRARRLAPGVVLQNRYTIAEQVAGATETYRAVDEQLGQDVSIQVLPLASQTGDGPVGFDRRVQTLRELSHPNVVNLVDVVSEDDLRFAITKPVHGESLRELIDSGIHWNAALNFGGEMADALAAMHRVSIVLGGLHAETVTITTDGRANIIDLGLAQASQSASTRITDATAARERSELAFGDRESGYSRDVVSLGSLLFEIITGERPTSRSKLAGGVLQNDQLTGLIASRDVSCPEELTRLIIEMMHVDSSRRPTAAQVRARLQSIRNNASADRDTPKSHPETCYTEVDGLDIAYQVIGNGPINLVLIPGFISNVDYLWSCPSYEKWANELASIARVAVFDKRGTGLSDRVKGQPNLDARLADICAVMRAAEMDSATMLGQSDGACVAAAFATRYPDQTDALITHGGYAPNRSGNVLGETKTELLNHIASAWGAGVSLPFFAPSLEHDAAFTKWWGKFERLGARPQAALEIFSMEHSIDFRCDLRSITAPSLVIHRREDVLVDPAEGRYLIEEIPGAIGFHPSGQDHLCWVGDSVSSELHRIKEFLKG